MHIKAVALSVPAIAMQMEGYEYEPYDMACRAMSVLQSTGAKLFLVHNQAVRGDDTKDLADGLSMLVRKLSRYGVTVTDYAFCPHSPKVGCFCRLPMPGSVLKLLTKHEVLPCNCWVVGASEFVSGMDATSGVKVMALTSAMGVYDACSVIAATGWES